MRDIYRPLALLLASIAGGSAPVAIAAALGEPIDTQHLTLQLERVAEGLEHPWSVTQLPDGRFLVTERPGRLALINEDGSLTHLEGVPQVSTHGQGGLLDVSLHPRYGDAEHDWIYLTWSQPGDGGSATTLSRARLDDNRLTDLENLFVQDRYSSPGRHYGSRLAWLPDETLLISVGERGTPARAQDSEDHAGGVLRLTASGSVPDDNPFLDDSTTHDEIFTLGNRNVQGLTVTQAGHAWATEHGPLTGDELNLLTAGENYGWPEVSQGRDYATQVPIGETSLPGMRDSAHLFDGRFAPSGLAEVTSDAYPEWQGNLLAGGLRSEQLHRLTLEGKRVIDSETVLDGELGRIRDIHQGTDGLLYLLSDAAQGSLYRLRPTP